MLDLSQYKTFIFDLDNTLIASEAQHTAAFRQAMLDLANYELTPEDIHDYIGNTSSWLANKIIRKMGYTNLTPEMIARRKAERVMEAFETKPYPGAMDFLNFMAGKVPLAVASNSPRDFVHYALKEMGAFDLMRTILTSEDVVKRKPAPDMLLKLAHIHGVAPSQCLVFEDSWLGIQAGVDGGFPTVLLINPGNLLPDVIPDGLPTMTWHQLGRLARENFA